MLAVEVRLGNGLVGGFLGASDRVSHGGDTQNSATRGNYHIVFQLGASVEGNAVVGIHGKLSDGVARTGLFGVVGRCQYYTNGGAAIPFDGGLVQLASQGQFEGFGQVAFDAHHDGLGFRVAHAAVEFQHLDQGAWRPGHRQSSRRRTESPE